MASKSEEGAPWDDFLSNFTLILESGAKFKCHKVMLAKASPVLKSMMASGMKEMQTNEMTLKGFDEETVTSFLQFIYATEDTIILNLTNDQRVCTAKDFESNKLTTQLLHLAHMYNVISLKVACVGHLKRTLSFDNAVDIWKTADELNIEELKLSATYSYLMCRKKTGSANNRQVQSHVLPCNCCQIVQMETNRAAVIVRKSLPFQY